MYSIRNYVDYNVFHCVLSKVYVRYIAGRTSVKGRAGCRGGMGAEKGTDEGRDGRRQRG